jgi:MFS transporter, CP family, cyanate transporter
VSGATAAASPAARRTAALVAILAAAFNLRIGIVAIGPIIEDIRSDTAMSSAVAGILTMIPFACMGAFAFLGPPLVRRIGEGRVILFSLGLIAAGTLLRSVVPDAVLVLLATLPIGLGIALIGVTLPAVVKVSFPDRGGAVTGAYVASLSLGVVIVGLGLVPLSHALGGWREALAVSAAPAFAAALLWVLAGGMTRYTPVADAAPPETAEESLEVAAPFHGGMGWRVPLLLSIAFGLQSMCFAGMVSWAPTIYEEGGWSQSQAALVTSSIGGFTVISSLTVPAWSEGRDRRPLVMATAWIMAIGVGGVALAPTNHPWLWLTMFGLGTGAVFSLFLTLPLDLSSDHRRVAILSAWMLGIGYLLSGLAPILVGAIRDLSGGFTAAMATLACLGIASGVIVRTLPRRAPGED